MITETDRVAEALEMAAKAWPEHRGDKNTLIKLLLDAGREALESNNHQSRLMRLDAIANASSQFAEVWPNTWREEIANEWPE